MKLKNFASILAIGLFLLGALGSAPAFAHRNRAGIVVLSVDELDPALAAQVTSATTPVVIEFYDPQDPDISGECAREASAVQATQQKFSGKVTLLRADIHSQNQDMIARAIITVCPTHLFVLERNGKTLVAKRIWGYLSEAQYEELFQEFYTVTP